MKRQKVVDGTAVSFDDVDLSLFVLMVSASVWLFVDSSSGSGSKLCEAQMTAARLQREGDPVQGVCGVWVVV